MRHSAFPRRRHLLAVLALLAGVASGCQRTVDVVAMPHPAGTLMELRLVATRQDSASVALHLAPGATASIGSLQATITAPVGWRYVGCEAGQGAPLLACHDVDGELRLAGAWVEGTHSGSLLTVTYVKSSGVPAMAWQLAVQDMRDAMGRPLADSIRVRREIAP